VKREVLRSEPPRSLQYIFQLSQSPVKSRVTAEPEPETEETKLTVTHDQWDDPPYAFCLDGWPRILSRLKNTPRNRQNIQTALIDASPITICNPGNVPHHKFCYPRNPRMKCHPEAERYISAAIGNPVPHTRKRCEPIPVILGSSVLMTYRDGNAPASSFTNGDGAG